MLRKSIFKPLMSHKLRNSLKPVTLTGPTVRLTDSLNRKLVIHRLHITFKNLLPLFQPVYSQ